MQRKALLLYLRELRDLEFANWKLDRMVELEHATVEKEYGELNYMEYRNEPVEFNGWTGGRKFGFWASLIMSLLYPILLFSGMIMGEKAAFDSFFQGICIFGFFIFGGIAIAIYISVDNDKRENEEERKSAEEFNFTEMARHTINKEKAEKVKSDWEARCQFFDEEYKKVNALLKANYDLNIIPSQYRNIASIYYIYDYMSTSNASLEETLIHEHMENGIQRIVERLDYVINLNYEIVIQNRRIEATNQQILQTNKEMLKQLENIEEQAYIATQYAELSANYSEATAYFSLANYLK